MTLSQTRVRVFAFSRTTGLPVTVIAGTITAKWAKDYGALTALADLNPTEAGDGYYYFDLSSDERNVTTIGEIFPESSNSDIGVIGIPSYLTPGPWKTVPAKVRVFAFNATTGYPEIGGQLKITAKWAKDYGALEPLADVNPVEAENGYYYFDLSASERDVTTIGELFAESSTNNVQVIGLPEFFLIGSPASSRILRDSPIVRSIDDNLPISFLWPTADATFVVRRSINDAAFEAASGTVGAALRQEGTRWRYQLSYNAADRPVAEGKAQYELTAGGVTRYLSLRVEVGDGGGAVNVLPLSGIVESRVDGTTISVFTSEMPTVSIAVVDGEGNAVTVTSLTLSLVIERRATADLVVIADASITKSGSTISFVVPSQATSAEGHHRWSLRDTADDSVLLQGPFIVTYAPTVDT
jgi:hypothetical protein